MAVDAAQAQYRDEFIKFFEQRATLLRKTVTTEAVIKGGTAIFLVAGSGSDTAVTRGVDGLIPARSDTETQYTATLVEWHDLRRKTRFNIFASQADQRAIMQMNAIAVLNRKIDQDILTALSGTSINTGAYVAGSLALILKAKTKLGNAGIPWDNNIFAIISPALEAFLYQTTEFASGDYVNTKPVQGADYAWDDSPKMRNWLGINFVTHPNVSGVGTSTEKCYLFHKNAIGSAFDTGPGLQTRIGYDDEQDYSFCRATSFFGTVLLQNAGIVEIRHDASSIS